MKYFTDSVSCVRHNVGITVAFNCLVFLLLLHSSGPTTAEISILISYSCH